MLSKVPTGVTAWTREATRRIVRDVESEGKTISHVWGWAAWPDHNNNRCVDLMVPTRADGDWLVAYLLRHRVQLRVRYVIWRRGQWRSYRKGVVRPWRRAPYFGRSGHYDHVHLEVEPD